MIVLSVMHLHLGKTMRIFLIVIIFVTITSIFVSKMISKSSAASSSGLSQVTSGTSNPITNDYGPVPEFTGLSKWLNPDDQTLSITQLKGKVVLVDFWTLGCINCIHTLPYVTKWYDTYKDRGLIVIGIHTPEFAYEHETNNVKKAIAQYKIHYPVAQDNDFATWKAFNNQYWPAYYLIDKKGIIRYQHSGEGEYETVESTIQSLLKE